MEAIYKKHDLLKKIATILGQRESNEMLSAHEIAFEIKKQYPKVFKAIGKPVGGKGCTQDSLTRYIARLLYPQIIPQVKQRFIGRMFGRTGVSKIIFKDGESQEMHPLYGLVLFALREPKDIVEPTV